MLKELSKNIRVCQHDSFDQICGELIQLEKVLKINDAENLHLKQKCFYNLKRQSTSATINKIAN